MYTQKNIFSQVFFKGPAPNQKFPKWASPNREFPKWASLKILNWASPFREFPIWTGPFQEFPVWAGPFQGFLIWAGPFREFSIWCWPIQKTFEKMSFFGMFSTPMSNFSASNSYSIRWHEYSTKRRGPTRSFSREIGAQTFYYPLYMQLPPPAVSHEKAKRTHLFTEAQTQLIGEFCCEE